MTPKQNESGVFLNMPENNEVFATNDNNDVTTKQTSHDQDTSARPSGSLLRRLLVAFIIGAGVLIPLAIAGLVAVGQIPPVRGSVQPFTLVVKSIKRIGMGLLLPGIRSSVCS